MKGQGGKMDVRFVDFCENVLEAAIVLFKNSVLSAHVKRPFFIKSVIEAAMGEPTNTLKNSNLKSSLHC